MTELGKTEKLWPRRQERAARTREAIVRTATRLLVERGYAATTMADVAHEADVSRATVFNAIGGKPQLLKAAYDVATVGDDLPIPLPQRPGLMAVRDEADQRQSIILYAGVIAEIGQRLSGIYEVFRAASASDPEISLLWADIQQQRLQGARGFVAILSSKGPLRAGLDPAQAGDIVWTLIDASLYHRLVHDRGWSHANFQQWLATSLEAQLM
jgi:AcrR family transcriptional regulator